MNRIVWRALNAPALILLICVGIGVQTSLFQYYPFMYLQPDVVLLAVIWVALRRDFTEGGILTLIAGNIAEIHSASPQGVLLCSYMLIYLLVRAMNRYVLLPRLTSLVGVTLLFSILWKLSGLGILWLIQGADNHWRHTLSLLFPGAVMEGAVAVWIYRLFEKFDYVTFKDPRREQLEDELHLDEESL